MRASARPLSLSVRWTISFQACSGYLVVVDMVQQPHCQAEPLLLFDPAGLGVDALASPAFFVSFLHNSTNWSSVQVLSGIVLVALSSADWLNQSMEILGWQSTGTPKSLFCQRSDLIAVS